MGNKATAQSIGGLINDLTDNELSDLTASETRPLLKIFLRNPRVVLGSFPSSALAANLIPRGWEVVEDVTPSVFHVKDLEFVSFLKNGESYVTGETMRKRAVELKANLGLVDGQDLLERQSKIPVEMRGQYIVLPGTVLRTSNGNLNVPYLYWDGGRWQMRFYWLDHVWDDNFRFARSK